MGTGGDEMITSDHGRREMAVDSTVIAGPVGEELLVELLVQMRRH